MTYTVNVKLHLPLFEFNFSPGHQDRERTISEILERDYKECHSGGKEERGHGSTAVAPIKQEEEEEGFEDLGDADQLENLIAAAEGITEEENTR